MAGSANACIVCMKVVLDGDKAIGCEGPCERWFHVECIKMPTSEYARFAGNKKLIWTCDRVDCTKVNNSPMNLLIVQIAELTGKMDQLISKVDCLKSEDIAPMRNEIKELNTKVTALEPRLTDSETRIAALEENVKLLNGTATGCETEHVIGELNDRSKRAANVIIYNLEESKSSMARDRQDHDNRHLSGIILACGMNLSVDKLKAYRLGKPSRGKIRPLKTIFESDADARSFMNKFSKDLVSSADDAYGNLAIGRDRTLRERQYYKTVKKDLDERVQKGEKSLVIKYINGIPTIVEKPAKN